MKSVFRLERLVVLALKTFMILIILCPILYAMNVSFMTTPEIFKRPPTLIPSSFLLTSYRQALKTAPLVVLKYFAQSAFAQDKRMKTNSLKKYLFRVCLPCLGA